VALDEVGRTSLEFWAEMLKRADKDLQGLDLAKAGDHPLVQHVKYESVISDPVESVRKIYANFGWNFTPLYEAKLEAYIAKNKAERAKSAAKKVSAHNYSLGMYGLSSQAVSEKVKWYADKYL